MRNKIILAVVLAFAAFVILKWALPTMQKQTMLKTVSERLPTITVNPSSTGGTLTTADKLTAAGF